MPHERRLRDGVKDRRARRVMMIEAQVDLRGVFEPDAVRAGLAGAIVTVRVRSNADDAVLGELGRTVTRASAVYDSLANPVPLELEVERMS